MKFFFVIDSKKADKDVVEGILNFFEYNVLSELGICHVLIWWFAIV